MDASAMRIAIFEAKRFIKAAESAFSEESDADKEVLFGGKYCAAAKRASMDLSRSLSNFRKG